MTGKVTFMYKFDIIEFQQQSSKIPLFELVVNKINFPQKNSNLMNEGKDLNFIIGEGQEKGFLGGVYLLKKKFGAIQEDIQDCITTLSLQNGYVWECSDIHLDSAPPFLLQETPPAATLSPHFYYKFYEKIVEFGRQKNIGFVIMKLTTKMHKATKEVGAWPYVVALNPKNSRDGYFHGILPLAGRQYELYLKHWESLKT